MATAPTSNVQNNPPSCHPCRSLPLTRSDSVTLGQAASHRHCVDTWLEVTWGKENTVLPCTASAGWASIPASLCVHGCPLFGSRNPLRSPNSNSHCPRQGFAGEMGSRAPKPAGKKHSLIRCHLETQLSSGLIIAMILWEGWE